MLRALVRSLSLVAILAGTAAAAADSPAPGSAVHQTKKKSVQKTTVKKTTTKTAQTTKTTKKKAARKTTKKTKAKKTTKATTKVEAPAERRPVP